MAFPHSIFKLKGVVQHYSWGGYDFIPSLLGIENTKHEPFAEYWLGAHPNYSSLHVDSNTSLADIITADKKTILGIAAKEYASLPFLLKVLNVRQMLSIQVHPGKESAIKGYEDENKKGIGLTAAHRNYKDDNHKPEMMVALSDFWLLHGFKKEETLTTTLDAIQEFSFLKNIFDRKNYKRLYEDVMRMDQENVNDVLSPLINRITPLYKNDQLKKDDANFWAARAALSFCKDNNYDRGIFSVYFLNLVHLKKGEGVFQPAGMPHAYLEGQNVEVMANSDNVLRAGLTEKHIDVPELMKHVKFEATIPHILSAKQDERNSFETPAEEFALEQYDVNKDVNYTSKTAEILLVLSGEIKLVLASDEINLKKGEAAFIAASSAVAVHPVLPSEFYRVFTPEKAS